MCGVTSESGDICIEIAYAYKLSNSCQAGERMKVSSDGHHGRNVKLPREKTGLCS